MYERVTKNVKVLHFVYAAKEDAHLHHNCNFNRFALLQTVTYTLSHHHFIALNANRVKMFGLSGDHCRTVQCVTITRSWSYQRQQHHYIHPRQFVAVLYNKDKQGLFIIEWSVEHQNLLVKLMNKTCTIILTWPPHDDICIVGCPSPMCFAFSYHQWRKMVQDNIAMKRLFSWIV